ncbi:hypothetical protein KIH41_01975 [Litoribacter ruber]|nr:hypothetical protein [Litoribacter ruber]
MLVMACNSRKAISEYFEVSIPKPLNVTKPILQNEGCEIHDDLAWGEKVEAFEVSEHHVGLGFAEAARSTFSFKTLQQFTPQSNNNIGSWAKLPLYILFKQWKSWLM